MKSKKAILPDYLVILEYFGFHFKDFIACSMSSMGFLFNFSSKAHFPTANATVSENSVNLETGGSIATPSLEVSIIPTSEWAAAEIILSVRNFASEASTPKPSPG